MGEVYLARDSKLNREVAIKMLLPGVAADPDRMARFSREAQLLASLNHSNIGSIYGLEDIHGAQALVMELVEGPTLADRIAQGPLALSDAVAVAVQVADGLEVAHDRGIIHRDLKPANIKVKADGTVKVLDFGLAKALDPLPSSNAEAMNSPTLTAQATRAGIILGTAAYMAPEQARGQAADRRADVWAFGCVLFEMLTGRMAFGAETTSDTIAAVLGREPDWTWLPEATPSAIRRLLRRCLVKDPKRRLRDLADARLDLEEPLEGTAQDRAAASSASRRLERLVWSSALAILALIAGVLAVRSIRAPTPPAEMRVEITTPPTTGAVSMAISPDGQKVVFVAASAEGKSRLWVRRLSGVSAEPLPGTDVAHGPFWSADSRSVGFFVAGKLKRIDIDGGAVTVLANAPLGEGGAWNRDGQILFAPVPASPLFQVPATGGEATPVTTVAAPQQVGHAFPQFLPDGRHFLFYVVGAPDVRGIHIGELGSAQTKRLLDTDAGAVYAASGHLLFVRDGKLLAQDFDAARLSLSGDPFEVAGQIVTRGATPALSASAAGPIIYRVGSAGAGRLTWFDRSGRDVGTVSGREAGLHVGPSLSRDGRHLALFEVKNGNADIWLVDVGRGTFRRFTDDAADDVFPIWSPDGSRIAFSSTRKRGLDLYLKPVSGTANEELLLATSEIKSASDWSGRFLLYSASDPQNQFDIWAVPVDGDRKPFSVVRTKFNERLAQFSPDGQWIAYESDESGRYEIYVQPFTSVGANGAGKVPVSTGGGAQPRWRHDGKALFYVAPDDRMMETPIRFAPNNRSAEPGAPVPLFGNRIPGGALQPFPRHQYEVMRDGRFLMVADNRNSVSSPLTLILNWTGRKN
jgi:Tol biopolymer transport system component